MINWTSNANEVLNLRLVHAAEDTSENDATASVFHPTFTYPIFGDEEKIYGYADLAVDVSFASGSLAYYFNMKSSARLPASTVDDVEGTLYKFIPSDYMKNAETFRKRVEDDAKTFRPSGTKVYSYTRKAKHASSSAKGKEAEADEDTEMSEESLDEESPDVVVFEAYHATWDTPGFRDLHRRMQFFILLYVEGGSYIQEDEEKWEFLALYERRRRKDGTHTYHFVGYTSLYPFFCWPDKVRLRLSQFVILPPYQKQGHGADKNGIATLASLYKAAYQMSLSRNSVAELTIEDPSEAFEELRDKIDLKMLLGHEKFIGEAYGLEEPVAGKGKGKKEARGGKLGPPTDKIWAETWRKELKIAQRQFERLIEILVLRRLDPTDEQMLRAYRLQVKERLYRFNFEILVTLDEKERKMALEKTFESVLDGYQATLSMFE